MEAEAEAPLNYINNQIFLGGDCLSFGQLPINTVAEAPSLHLPL
jgi:hypothetical protein